MAGLKQKLRETFKIIFTKKKENWKDTQNKSKPFVNMQSRDVIPKIYKYVLMQWKKNDFSLTLVLMNGYYFR